ncbi:MAG TPA: hypothetical protein VG308_16850 [Stellaceae bacterium]|jgi:hypothetical protein|nr:hypothetical protein [Stellaceae bacterium]
MLLGEVLAELGHASREQIQAALAHQRRHGGYVGAILVAIGAISAEQLSMALRLQQELTAVEALEAIAA